MVVVGVEGVRSVERGAVRQLGGVGSEMRMGISGKGERRGRGDMPLARHSIEVPRRVPAQEFVCAGVVGGAVGLLSVARHICLSIEASRGVLLPLCTYRWLARGKRRRGCPGSHNLCNAWQHRGYQRYLRLHRAPPGFRRADGHLGGPADDAPRAGAVSPAPISHVCTSMYGT